MASKSDRLRPHLLIVLLLVVAASCARHSPPEQALQHYIDAVNEERCDAAYQVLSERTRYSLDALRVKPQHPQSPLPIEEYYCRKLIFEDCKWGKMHLDEQHGDTAKVSMPCGRTQDGFLPGFSSPFLKYEPRITELVNENGAWHVVVPMVIRIVEMREREERTIAEYREREEERRRAAAPPTSTK